MLAPTPSPTITHTLATPPPMLTIGADFVPGGITILCPKGLKNVRGEVAHNPLAAIVTIQCHGETKEHHIYLK